MIDVDDDVDVNLHVNIDVNLHVHDRDILRAIIVTNITIHLRKVVITFEDALLKVCE